MNTLANRGALMSQPDISDNPVPFKLTEFKWSND